MNNRAAEHAKAVAFLKAECLNPGDTIIGFLCHEAKNGTRYLGLAVLGPCAMFIITSDVAKALNVPYNEHLDALRISPSYCIKEIIFDLAYKLFGNFNALIYKGA